MPGSGEEGSGSVGSEDSEDSVGSTEGSLGGLASTGVCAQAMEEATRSASHRAATRMGSILLKWNPIFEASFIGLGGVGGSVRSLERTLKRERV